MSSLIFHFLLGYFLCHVNIYSKEIVEEKGEKIRKNRRIGSKNRIEEKVGSRR